MTDTYYSNVFYRTTDLHLQFEGKSVFIAGNTGFYGRWFQGFFNYLQKSGVNVQVHGGSYRSTGLDVVNWRTYPKELIQADYIINCAGDARGGDLTTHDLGGAGLREYSDPDAILLHFSSGGVSSQSPSDYSLAKRSSEIRLKGRSNVQIVRPFATVGPGMGLDTNFAIPTFLRRRSGKLPLEVAPNVIRSFCHVADLIVQCLHVMIAGDGQPYEVGSDDYIALWEAAKLISEDVQIVEKDYPTRAAADHYVADLFRVNNQFNLDLNWTSVQAIQDTVRYYSSSKCP